MQQSGLAIAPVIHLQISCTGRSNGINFLTARLAAPEVADRNLAESVLSSTYWGREDDLDIEYSLIFQQNGNLMLAHCLRRWLNINPTLAHMQRLVSGEMWRGLSMILPVKFSATRHVSFNVGPAS